jgi:hypothetical protein
MIVEYDKSFYRTLVKVNNELVITVLGLYI